MNLGVTGCPDGTPLTLHHAPDHHRHQTDHTALAPHRDHALRLLTESLPYEFRHVVRDHGPVRPGED